MLPRKLMNGEVLEEEKLSSVKRRLPVFKSWGTQPQRHPDPPTPIFIPHLSAAPTSLISAACLSHGPGAEAERKAISVPAAKQFLLPPITRCVERHFRPAPRHTRSWGRFGRGLLETGTLEFKAWQRAELCSPPPPPPTTPRRLWGAPMFALPACGFLVAQGG